MKVLIKSMRPHRQKVMTEDGEEVRLQQWANKKAASALRTAGGEASGEQFTQARDALMREAVASPDEHGLKFMGERMPFEGQELEESLSDPMDDPAFKENMTEDESFELAEKLDRKTPDIFDEKGNLRQTLSQEDEGFLQANNKVTHRGMPSEERTKELLQQEEDDFDPDAEAEHMRRIMTSRQVPMRDAWSVLKEMPPCQVCQERLSNAPDGKGMVCQNTNCPAAMMRQNANEAPRLRFPPQMFPTGGFNSLEEMTENARKNPDYSRDMYS